MMHRKVVVYARQSRSRDGSESLDTQVKVCTEAAERLGLKVVATLIEAPSTSGYKQRGTTRKKWKELLAGFEDHRWDVVMAYKTDRLSRGGGPGWAPLLEAIEEAGLNVDKSIAVPSGFISEFEIGIRAAMDREESKKLSERQLDIKTAHARAGRDSGGERPYGFEPDRITIRESEADVLREMVRRYLIGHSTTEIAWWLNEQGHPMARGGQWASINVRNLLRRKRIGGIREHNGVDYPAVWPAIIDKETFERLQIEIQFRAERNGTTPKARKYLLTGLVHCAKCGKPMVGNTRRDRPGKPQKPYYVCRMRGNYQREHGCGRTRRYAVPLEHFVREAVFYRLDTPELAELLSQSRDDSEVKALLGKLGALKERKGLLADMFARGELDRGEFARAKQANETALQDVQERLSASQQSLAGLDIDPGQTLRQAWEESDSDEWRRRLLSLIIERIDLLPGRDNPPYLIDGARYRFDPERVDIRWRV